MKKKSTISILTLLCLFVLTGCVSNKKTSLEAFKQDVYTPEYATGFKILGADNSASTLIQISNPWQGAKNVEMSYFISRNSEQAPTGFTGPVIRAGAKRIVCMSSSYIAMLDAIGQTDRIVGVSGIDYVSNPYVLAHKESIRDMGAEMNYELLIGLKPDVVLLYGIGDAQTSVTDKMRELSIPYMYVGEYLEESSEVQAACPWYPPTDLSAFPCESAEQCASSAESLLLGFNSKRNREKAYNCSPVSKVTKDAPPFLIIHGNCDRTVPYVQSKTLYNLLEAQGCDVTLLTLDGADHADLQFFQDETWNWIIDFFNRKLK